MLIVIAATAPTMAFAQSMDSVRRPAFVEVNGSAVEAVRDEQLVGRDRVAPNLLLRSASSLTPSSLENARPFSFRLIEPHLTLVSNSAMPFSQNRGSLWAGKGTNLLALMGFRAEWSRVRLIVAPEFAYSPNSDWNLRENYFAPPVPVDRSEFTFAYYTGRFTIDQPMRYGTRQIQSLMPGQSTLLVRAGLTEIGASTENEWWGPGVRNAIVISDNANGLPHLFVRSGSPIQTRAGALDFRWLVGQLEESEFFDTLETNQFRSLSLLGATLRTRWDPNLTLGFAHAVFATASSRNEFASRWLDVLTNPSKHDSTVGGRKKDQILSLFFRRVFPDDGLELYGEWARNEAPSSLRDFFVAPNHSQGYTLGAVWRSSPSMAFWRMQAELTQLEQSATFRNRSVSSWYTSENVPQGYTHRGQILGASIGPGASTQFVGADYVRKAWEAGGYLGRIRWNEDVHTNFGFPAYVSYCNHDLSVFPGVRGKLRGRIGTFSADLTLQNRLNAFFQNAGGCPNNGRRLDIRNQTLTIRYTPFAQ